MFTFNYEEAGKRLKNLRTSRKLSLEAVGKAVDTSRQTISTYEKGTAKYDSEILCRLSKFFNVSTDYLLGLSEVPSPIDMEETAICQKMGISLNAYQRIYEINNVIVTDKGITGACVPSESFFDSIIKNIDFSLLSNGIINYVSANRDLSTYNGLRIYTDDNQPIYSSTLNVNELGVEAVARISELQKDRICAEYEVSEMFKNAFRSMVQELTEEANPFIDILEGTDNAEKTDTEA